VDYYKKGRRAKPTMYVHLKNVPLCCIMWQMERHYSAAFLYRCHECGHVLCPDCFNISPVNGHFKKVEHVEDKKS